MIWTKDQIMDLPSFKPFLKHVEIIELHQYSNTGLTVDTCKSLIEGICKTILLNKGEMSHQSKFHMLVKQGCEIIFEGVNLYNGHIVQIVGSFSSICQALGTIRNDYGFSSHGSDVLNPLIDELTSNFIVKVTDDVCGFILQCYSKNRNQHRDSRLHYEDCKSFNEKFDAENPWGSPLIILSASEALYNQDYEAYKESYFEYLNELEQILKDIQNDSNSI